MKISVITVVYNNKQYLEDAIKSVIEQSYNDIEYIIIDGGSDDGSLEIIKKYDKYITRWISESDSGIYDAMNKGVLLSTGDVICFLNSDDVYYSKKVLSSVVKAFIQEKTDSCYGDVVYKSRDMKKVVRYWRAGLPEERLFIRGWMPPHPAFFVKKNIFNRAGSFRTDFRISADYELSLRYFKKENITSSYIPEILVNMRVGGKSNRGLNNLVRKSYEDLKAWKVNDLSVSPMIMIWKPLLKISQFFGSDKN